jgi:hypothetical protein
MTVYFVFSALTSRPPYLTELTFFFYYIYVFTYQTKNSTEQKLMSSIYSSLCVSGPYCRVFKSRAENCSQQCITSFQTILNLKFTSICFLVLKYAHRMHCKSDACLLKWLENSWSAQSFEWIHLNISVYKRYKVLCTQILVWSLVTCTYTL